MEYTNLMVKGKNDEFKLWNMMLACLGRLNIQWVWPRCPSPWHSRHLARWVFMHLCMPATNHWNHYYIYIYSTTCNPFWQHASAHSHNSYRFNIFRFEGTLGSNSKSQNNSIHWTFCDSMLASAFHSCLSPSMLGNENKLTTFYRWQWKYLTALLSKFVPYGDHNFTDKCRIKLNIIKRHNKTNPVTLRPRDSVWFLLVSSHFLYPNSKRPIPAQKWTISTANTSQHPKAKQCNNLPMYEPFCHLARATPKTTRKPFRGHGRRCWPHPLWPPQRSAARPRRRGRSQPPNAAASSLGRRGCDAKGGAAAAAVEKQGVAMDVSPGGWVKFWVGHR